MRATCPAHLTFEFIVLKYLVKSREREILYYNICSILAILHLS
jgi:hypothetical protein